MAFRHNFIIFYQTLTEFPVYLLPRLEISGLFDLSSSPDDDTEKQKKPSSCEDGPVSNRQIGDKRS